MMLEMKGQLPPTQTHSVMSEGTSELRQHSDPKPAGGAGGEGPWAPDSQEAISLTLSPRALRRGWALGGSCWGG